MQFIRHRLSWNSLEFKYIYFPTIGANFGKVVLKSIFFELYFTAYNNINSKFDFAGKANFLKYANPLRQKYLKL